MQGSVLVPESNESFAKRQQLQKQAQDIVRSIEDADDSPQDKTVELLAFIANLLIEQNFTLDTISNELFDHTVALENISER